jgi:hypothetical protein
MLPLHAATMNAEATATPRLESTRAFITVHRSTHASMT